MLDKHVSKLKTDATIAGFKSWAGGSGCQSDQGSILSAQHHVSSYHSHSLANFELKTIYLTDSKLGDSL